ncbi:MAG: ATP-binding protein [Solirubrobacterales bacterium]
MNTVEPEDRVEFLLPARADNVPLVRHALAGLAEELGMDPSDVADLKTIVTEACMNVVIHAYDDAGPVEITAWADGEVFTVRVRDFGRGIRPLADIDRRSLRLGLPLIAALTVSFEVRGVPGEGTEVTMRIPISQASTRSGGAAAAGEVETGSEARIAIPAGDLLAPILSRVVSMYAARADFSVDKLSDAVLLSDAISAHGPEGFPRGTARLAISEEEGAFAIRVGPLAAGAGQRLVDGMRIPMLDASLEDLADEVRVETGEGADHLVVRLAQRAESETGVAD